MGKDIFVIAEHLKGKLADITFEMLGKGRELADLTDGRLFAILVGQSVRDLAEQMGVVDAVLYLEDDRLAEFTPEAYQRALAELMAARRPWLTLVGSTSMGLDLAAPLSATLGIPLVASCKDLQLENGKLIATSQLYGGKMLLHVEVETEQAIASILAGAFRAEGGIAEKIPPVEAVALTTPLENLRMHFERLIEPEAGEVDITQAPILVSVGRGIQNQDNLTLAQELAQALGGAVSASRPVVDQGWLPMTRQVGRSGMIVRPRLYLALGISGAPEHAEGMRDSELIIAVNTDPNAPIFSVADYGIVADALEFVPALTEEMKKRKQIAHG
ncbi:MAG: electron transfer flavoprotein subunit alpha/FixB family protein [Acidobacteria bacterium]|nr:electron transfer flavoprotein subunit alpha/FixB family protein [Acidobacteriota bacterium]